MSNQTKRTIVSVTVIVLLLVPAIYVAVKLLSFVNRPYVTQTAVKSTLSDSTFCEGLVAFTEQTLPSSGLTGYLVQDGVRVAAGTQVAEVYTEQSQAQGREQLRQLEEQLDLLQRSQVSGNVDTLAGQAQRAVLDVLDGLASGAYGTARSAADEYLLAENRLQVTTGLADGFGSAIEQLNSQKEALSAQVGQPQPVAAAASGYFVSAESASFLSVNATALGSYSPAQLQQALEAGATQSREGFAGKIVTSYTWYFYGVCALEESEKFTEGGKVRLSFPDKAPEPLPATVTEVVEDEAAGIAKITLRCEYIGAQVLALAQEEARIDFATYEGVRIPAEALHIVNGEKGVYVKHGDLARFRRITVLYETDEYILVPEGGKVGTENEVRLYDEVIVSGTDLADGKKL